jgi:hypothetical protein
MPKHGGSARGECPLWPRDARLLQRKGEILSFFKGGYCPHLESGSVRSSCSSHGHRGNGKG